MPWIANTYYYKDAFTNSNGNTPDAVFSKVYQTAKDNWDSWSRNAQ